MADRVVLITGAGSGIGRATASAFLKAGDRVVLCGRREAALRETVDLAGGGQALCSGTDVADAGRVEALFAAIAARWGRLDVVFNNAGVMTPPAVVGDVSLQDWRQSVAVNLDGAFYVARAAFIAMRDQDPQGGRIINNGSISAHVPRWGSAPYTATKHAVTGLTRAISLDGRAYSIACGQIDIGNAASDMTRQMAAGSPQADGTLKPEPRMDVRHVADAVLHMASLPLDANVQFMTIVATNMPFIGRG